MSEKPLHRSRITPEQLAKVRQVCAELGIVLRDEAELDELVHEPPPPKLPPRYRN